MAATEPGRVKAPDLRNAARWDTAPHPTLNLWGTGNVEEVLPGITRPLAADISTAYMTLYAGHLLRTAGIEDLVPLAQPPAANIFGFFGGRWCVNIAWLGAYVQSYQPDQASDMLGTMVRGGKTASGVSADGKRARETRARVEKLWAQALEQANTTDRETSAAERRNGLAANLAETPEADLLATVDRLIDRTGEIFVRHALVSIGGAEQLAPLAALLDRAIPGHPPEWSTQLTSALRDVESAGPIGATWDLAQAARKLPAVKRDLASRPAAELRELLTAPPNNEWRTFAAEVAGFMEGYGFRGQRETDPSVPDWGEDPTFVLAALHGMAGLPASKSPAKSEERTAREREKLEAKIEKRLAPADRAAFRDYLDIAQRYVRGRETTKANWVRTTRAFRPPLRELGRRLAARKLISAPDDVFFLRLAELRAAVADPATKPVTAIVKRRKAEYERLQGYTLPVTFTLPVVLEPAEPPAAPALGVLTGLAVSSGVATGRARVIMDAEAGDSATIEPGEVLVAPYTDAPWTPLFWPAAAVIVERGGMLSHASTVAREFGIPAVVGIANATSLIPTGTLVTVDGNSGTVTVQAG